MGKLQWQCGYPRIGLSGASAITSIIVDRHQDWQIRTNDPLDIASQTDAVPASTGPGRRGRLG
jgi:hypothetical protein